MTVFCDIQFGPGTDVVVATLGDPLGTTCSVEFAKSWLAPAGGRIMGYESFETAADAVVSGEADYLMVPAEYPHLAGFIFDTDLTAHDQFRDQLPTIVLVAKNQADPDLPPARLYHHPAVSRDAENLLAEWETDVPRVLVSSNPVACERAMEDPFSYALTNVIAAKGYGLTILKDICADNFMPCVIFKATSAPDRPRDLRPWLGLPTRKAALEPK